MLGSAIATLDNKIKASNNVAIVDPNTTQESKALDLDSAPTTAQPITVPVQETTTEETSTPEASGGE